MKLTVYKEGDVVGIGARRIRVVQTTSAGVRLELDGWNLCVFKGDTMSYGAVRVEVKDTGGSMVRLGIDAPEAMLIELIPEPKAEGA